jgi:hypothetical protein
MQHVEHGRIRRWAQTFLEEVRYDVEQAVRLGLSLPPRIRSVHERSGHATPEFRTLAIPVSSDMAGLSPEILAASIAAYARQRPPAALLFAFDATSRGPDGELQCFLLAEARDATGTRLFWRQRYTMCGSDFVWEEPHADGWVDPGGEEMILDAAFAAAEVPAAATPS